MGFSSEDRAAIIQRNYVTRVGYVGVSSVLFFTDAWCSQAFSKKDCIQDLAPISRPKNRELYHLVTIYNGQNLKKESISLSHFAVYLELAQHCG